MRELLSQRCSRTDAQLILQQLRHKKSLVAFSNYLFDNDNKVNRNAAWILTQATDNELLQLLPLYDKLADLALQTPNTALKRLTLNILQRMPVTPELLRTDFLNFCLEHMTMPRETAGVQALCMKIAHQLCQFHPDLQHEFRCIVESMEACYYTPAVNCVRQKILKKGV